MKELNYRQKTSLNRMINASALAEVTLTKEDMDYYNANYGEENRDVARMDDISKKLRTLMMMDTENVEVLKDVYTEDYEAAMTDERELKNLSEVSGFKKLFNYKAKKRAKNRLDDIRDKKQILKERSKFDSMYAKKVDGASQRFKMQAIDGDKGLIGEEIQLNSLERLGFKSDKQPIDYNEARDYIMMDKSEAPKYIKYIEYSEENAEYFYHSRVFREKNGENIGTDWVKRDIVGYCCSMDKVDQDQDTFVNHAENLNMIVTKPQEVTREVVSDEMEFLDSQIDVMKKWEKSNKDLFTDEVPKGKDVIWHATEIKRAFNKLQISKSATKAIIQTEAYKNMDENVKNAFEKNTVAYIWAMHSYLTALGTIAKRQFDKVHNLKAVGGQFLTWEQSLEVSNNTNFRA